MQMNIIIDFLLAHWILTAIFITLLGFYLALEVLYSQQDNKVSPQSAVDLINHKHAVVLDIRQKTVFEASHIIDAINIPFKIASDPYKKIQKYTKKPIILVGTNQKELTKVAALLKQQDFQQVLQLTGGMQEWLASGLPTASSKTSKLP